MPTHIPEGSGLHCPKCNAIVTSGVVDCRLAFGGFRRRRECQCGERFTTLETVVELHPGQPVGMVKEKREKPATKPEPEKPVRNSRDAEPPKNRWQQLYNERLK